VSLRASGAWPICGGTREEEAARRRALEAYVTKPATGRTKEEQRARYVEGMRELYTEDAVRELPQSGELIRGLEDMLRLVEGHPDFPSGELRRIIGAGDLFVLEAKLVYGQGEFWEAMVMQFRGDRVCRSTEYYAMSFEPPEWRAEFVELM
jgi:hypothetical protein